MGYQSARLLVVDDVANPLGVIQVWSADQEEESFRYREGMIWRISALFIFVSVLINWPCKEAQQN